MDANGAATNTIRVDLTDEDGAFANAATKQVNVNNVAPLLSGLTAAAVDENGTSFLHGVIADPGAVDTYSLQIYWGDSGTPQTINLPAGTTSFAVPHQYLDDPAGPPPDEFPIDVILRDDDGGQDTDSLRVTVRNIAPEASILGLQIENPVGELVSLTAGVSDPGLLDVFAYDWHVERESALFASGIDQHFGFTPDAAGTYVVRLSVQDDDGGVDAVAANVRVPGGNNVEGDTNADGLVDLIDLNNVRNNFGGVGLGDTNGDGVVDLEDLNAVRNNFGVSGAKPVAAPASVRSVQHSAPQFDRLADAVFHSLAAGEHENPLSPAAIMPNGPLDRIVTFAAKKSLRARR